MKTLPKYFAIKRDETDPLWHEYSNWIKKQTAAKPFLFDGWLYIGRDFIGWNGSNYLNSFDLPDIQDTIQVITLSDWAEAVGYDSMRRDNPTSVEDDLKNLLRIFLQSIMDYEHEGGDRICDDEREPEEFVQIFIESEDGFNFRNVVKQNAALIETIDYALKAIIVQSQSKPIKDLDERIAHFESILKDHGK